MLRLNRKIKAEQVQIIEICRANGFSKNAKWFDWNNYLGKYPDLKQAGLHSIEDAIKHWNSYGYIENRELTSIYADSLLKNKAKDRLLKKNTTPLVTVITRTSGRKKFFAENRHSVCEQSYPNIRHWVISDSPEDLYVKETKGIKIFPVTKTQSKSEKHFPPNEYINKILSKIKRGWILFLDDDDIFSSPSSLKHAVSQLHSEEELLLWKVGFPGFTAPPQASLDWFRVGWLSSAGCLFHSKYAKYGLWDDYRGADGRAILRLKKILKLKLLDEILTKVNYEKERDSSFSGQRQDK